MLIATGRMFRSVRPYLEAAGIDDPVICYQGAVVADPGDRRVPAPRADSRSSWRARRSPPSRRRASTLNCYVDDELYVARVTPEAERYATFQHLPHPRGRRPRSPGSTEPPTKLVTVGDPDALDVLEARMKDRFGGRLYISKSLPFFLEFASPA